MMQPILDFNHVSLSLPGKENAILSDIHYQIYPGDFIILLGSNGSGKSSLLKLIDQRYRPTQGMITFRDQNLHNMPRRHLNHTMATLTQNCHDSLFPSLTVFDHYQLVKRSRSSFFNACRLKEEYPFLSEFLPAFNKNLIDKLEQKVESLSGGEKQALALALIMLYPPEILLLDEHTSALDPHSAQQIMQITRELVHQHKITCILTTHDLSIAEECGNRILALRNGKLFQQIDSKQNLNRQELLAACY